MNLLWGENVEDVFTECGLLVLSLPSPSLLRLRVLQTLHGLKAPSSELELI